MHPIRGLRVPTALAMALSLACATEPPSPPPAPETSHDGAGLHHGFSDVERFVQRFDAPERDAWQRPAEVVALLDAPEGAIVADLGAGTGYFAAQLSHAVGPSGRVLALDVEPNMVAYMRERFARDGLTNAEAREVSPDDPGLPPASVDRILIVNTWHHVGGRARYAARLRDALRPGGAVLIVDFTPESPQGPPPHARLAADAVVAELVAGGLEAEILEETLPWQYVVRGAR